MESNLTKAEENRVMFFEKLKERSRDIFYFYIFDNISSRGGYDASLVKSIGMGVKLKYWKKTGPGAVVELIIENKDVDLNKNIYEYLSNQKETIEKEFGGPLSWDGNINPKTGKVNPKRSSIRKKYNFGELNLQETWEALQDRMIPSMKNFYEIFPPRVQEFKDKYGRSYGKGI